MTGPPVFQPLFTTTDKNYFTKSRHNNAIVERKNGSTSSKKEALIDVPRFSGVLRLFRTTTPAMLFKEILHQKRKRDLRIEDMDMAKTKLYEQIQLATFLNNIKHLTTKKALYNKDVSVIFSIHRW